MKQTQDKQPKVVEVQAGAWHPGPMTDADFEAWENLPNKVVWKHFRWAFENQDQSHGTGQGNSPSPNGNYCGVALDDLLQEARLGLMDAWEKYNPAHASSAKFVTYAYTVIHRRVKNVVLNQRGRVRGGSIDSGMSNPDLDIFVDHEENGEGQFVCDDFNAECLELLKMNLPKGGYAILVESFRGKTFQEIGKRHGYSREHARKLYNEMMVKAADILQRKDES